MRFRFWLYLLFSAFAIIPAIILGFWVHNQNERFLMQQAGSSFQMLAETHARTIEQYLANSRRVFDSYINQLDENGKENPMIDQKLDFEKIIVFNSNSGKVIEKIDPNGYIDQHTNNNFPNITYKKLANLASSRVTKITPIIKTDNDRNVFYFVRKKGNKLIAGEMGTQFFINLASATRFEKSGHAAIFDQKGQLIAHPKIDWQQSAKSISQLAPVKMANSGENGIVQFYSPAVKTKMLAGFATIGSTKWGIMVPQRIDELLSQSGLAKKSISVAILLTLAIVLLASIIISNTISIPLEKMISGLKKASYKNDLKSLNLSNTKSPLVPTEHKELEASFNEMIDSLNQSHDKLKELAFKDHVTGLPNREAFRKSVEESLSNLASRNLSAAMVFIDIDSFKEINDTHGHHVGDQVLRCLGSRISDIVEAVTGVTPTQIPDLIEKNKDLSNSQICLGRFGGDEFTLFIPETNGLTHLDLMTSQILEAIAAAIPGLETNTKLSGSIGIASFPEHGLTFSELVKRADIAMYHAKKIGKGQIKMFGDGTGDLTAAEIRRDVHFAIHNDQLELYYQPKVCAQSHNVKSVEALVRWFHPEKGIINPAEFIPAIENSDTTSELGEWVIRRACRDMRHWDELGYPMNIAVNIAARQFISKDFVSRLHEITIEEGCEPNRLEIEVTEETALSTHDGAANIINELQQMGFRVSLDDYGRGYSNLTRLSELRVNTIKIDGPLTARLTRDERTRVIFEATINMAKGLHCKTVAEGVETEEEAIILSKLGCTELQGYHFSTPLPFKALTNWIEERSYNPAREIQRKIAANF